MVWLHLAFPALIQTDTIGFAGRLWTLWNLGCRKERMEQVQVASWSVEFGRKKAIEVFFGCVRSSMRKIDRNYKHRVNRDIGWVLQSGGKYPPYSKTWSMHWLQFCRPQVSFYWMLYESLKTHFIPGYTPASSRAPSPSVSGLSEESLTLRYLLTSSAACAISVTVTNPIDAVQARWQTSGGKAGGLRDIVKTMWRTGRTSAFLRGIGARIAYTVCLELLYANFYVLTTNIDSSECYLNDHLRTGEKELPAQLILDASLLIIRS